MRTFFPNLPACGTIELNLDTSKSQKYKHFVSSQQVLNKTQNANVESYISFIYKSLKCVISAIIYDTHIMKQASIRESECFARFSLLKSC